MHLFILPCILLTCYVLSQIVVYVLYLAQEKKTYSNFFGISFSFATADHLPPSSFSPYP